MDDQCLNWVWNKHNLKWVNAALKSIDATCGYLYHLDVTAVYLYQLDVNRDDIKICQDVKIQY